MRRIKKIIKALRSHDNYLVTSHINSEGDSIGSQIAMARLLKAMGKRYIIVDSDPVPESLRFILAGEKIKSRVAGSDRFETIVSVDCPVLERTGSVAKYFKSAGRVINIDHHVSNSRFGDDIWIDKDASCCGEMLFHLYKHMKISIDRKSALAIYVAIITDSGRFSYENTNYKTHLVVAELLKRGISPLWVGNQLNEKKSLNEMALLTKTLGTLQMYFGGQVSVIYTSGRMLKDLGVGPEKTEGFVNYARSINTSKIAIFFLERPGKPGEVHVSFRSKGDVDVNVLASRFKGGGHPNAAGCMIRGSMDHARKAVLAKIKDFL